MTTAPTLRRSAEVYPCGWLLISRDIVSSESVRKIYNRFSRNGLSPGFTFPRTVVTAI